MLILVLIFPVCEIYLLVEVWRSFGFMNTLFALSASAILGAGLAKNQGRFLIRRLQEATARGETPTDEVFHGVFVFLGGLLLIVPGFISDVIGVTFVLPGTRHLVVRYFKRRFQARVGKGGFKVFTFGNVRGMRPPPNEMGRETSGDLWTKDVSPRVIDVTPISAESSKKHQPGSD